MELKEDSVIAVYKPKGITSHDVVNIIRKASGVKRVGHGGTLDPLAEGVLVIGIGRNATKTLDNYTLGNKEYEATIKLGQTSITDDDEGEKTNISTHEPTSEEIQKVLPLFIGKIKQTPPIYSAIKIKGKPAYKYARHSQKIEMEPRNVEITNIDFVSYNYPALIITIECKKGVYIRSLARDIGEKLNTGAYLTNLIRTKVGKFTIKDTISLDKLE